MLFPGYFVQGYYERRCFQVYRIEDNYKNKTVKDSKI